MIAGRACSPATLPNIFQVTRMMFKTCRALAD